MPAGELPISVEDEGKLPGERFRDFGQVQDLCKQMISSDRKRNLMRAEVERLWAGNPVYSLARLKAKGQGWRARVNHRGLEGVTNTISNAIYNLDVEVKDCVRIGLDYGEGPDRRRWEKCIAARFTKMVMHDWEDADFHIQRRIRDMVLHGTGYHFYSTKGHWIPRTPATGCILFPDDAPLNFVEDGEYMMARDHFTGVRMHGYIRNESTARTLGWNIDTVWKWLARSSKRGLTDDPEQVQRLYKQGDLGASTTRQSGGWMNYLFVREFDDDEHENQISLYIVPEGEDVGDFIFKKRFSLKSWPVQMFPFDIGNGTIQSVRGIGERMKDFFELQNRIKNAMADQVLTGSGTMVRQTATIDPDKLKLMRVGLFSIIPQGLEVVPQNLQNLSNGPLALEQNLKQGMMENNSAFMQQEPERADRQTGMEYSMRSQNSSQVSKGMHNFYYRCLGRDYAFKLRTAIKPQTGNSLSAELAKKFREGCIKDGVPKEAFDHIEEITPVRSVGAGSAAARYNALTQLFQFVYPNASEDRKINLEQDIASALVGYQQANDYARDHEDNDIPTSDDSLAVVENDVLTQGGEALAASSQDHVKHAQRHLTKGGEIQQMVEGEQMEPQQALGALMAILEHAGQHLGFLQGNPLKKQEFAELQKVHNSMVQFSKHLEAIVGDMEDAARQHGTPEQQLSEDGMAKMAKVEAQNNISLYKAQQDSERKWEKLKVDSRLKDASTAVEIRRKSTSMNGAGPL